MTSTYSAHAAICAKFYELTMDSSYVADVVFAKARAAIGEQALFVGGMFEIASELASRGMALTVVDYTIDVRDSESTITRTSTTERVTDSPLVVNWRARYSGEIWGKPFTFDDTIEHRAFSRPEFASCVSRAGFQVIEQGDNFNETSFYTLAQRTV